jgi:alpha-tubulin suppressor-like RCC1 family protein
VLGDGSVRCWGFNTSGELGYGNLNYIGDDETPGSVGPVDLGLDRKAVSVNAGGGFTCALLDDGTVRCWGMNDFGQLGYGNTNNIGDNETPGSVGPVDLGTGRSALTVSAGLRHACALLDDGTVRCWGHAGSYGALGYGNTSDIGDTETPGSVGPVNLAGSATAISAGNSHTCAVLFNGSVRCWGDNQFGQLGYANTNDIGDDEFPSAAGPVDLGAGRTAVAISAGGDHTCAILDNGTLRCWGSGADGVLGSGAGFNNVGDDETPGSVATVDIGAGRTAVGVSAGGYDVCVVLDDGTVRCWGAGQSGELGDPAAFNQTIGDNETPGSQPTVDIGAGRSAVAVAAGVNHTCVLLDDGTIRCWGDEGLPGYGNTATIGDDETPGSVGVVDVGLPPGTATSAVSAGSLHTCAIVDDGSVRCWGAGLDGRLGYKNTNTIGDDEAPAAAGPVDLGSVQKAVAVDAGEQHTCALLIGGKVQCWGDFANGRLGTGGTQDVGDDETPGSAGTVDLGRSAVAISVGGEHACALLDNGTVECWGKGADGRLGYNGVGDVGDDETPASMGAVNLGGSAAAIAAGVDRTCALLTIGSVECWGNGASGGLGYGNTNDIGDNEEPASAGVVFLGAGRFAVAITVGARATCALLDNGTVRCWGDGSGGALGYGNVDTIGDDEAPGSVGPLNLGRSAVAISAGDYHTCALLDNGTVRCWGVGSDGRLGYGNTNDIGDDETPNTVGPVSLSRSAIAINAGGDRSCAILDAGTLSCWGNGSSGALGYGNTDSIGDDESPSAVGSVRLVSAPRTLTLRYNKRRRRFIGVLSSPATAACSDRRGVTIWKVRRGPDAKIAVLTTPVGGAFTLRRRARPGAYYATAELDSPGVADCLAARSPNVRVR